MTVNIKQVFPPSYIDIVEATGALDFTMGSHASMCSLLRTLACTKPAGKLLELGTGTGLATAWILDGMDENSSLTSLENDSKVMEIAQRFLGGDKRLSLVRTDAGEWISKNSHLRFDYIFADTWHGKYLLLDETLSLLNKGGVYIIDDMLPQPNWPEGHSEKVKTLIECLENRDDIFLTQQHWSTGVVVAVKK